jgi:molybdopterin molybdotransferase
MMGKKIVITVADKREEDAPDLLKRIYGEGTVTLKQGTYRLSSYAKANCLIQLDENEAEYKKGSVVEVHLLP